MALDLSKLSAASNSISQLSGLILVTPQFQGIRAQNDKSNSLEDSLVFDLEADNLVSLQSDITDYLVEDNTVRNDQIAIKPEIYTVRGFIGEVKIVQDDALRDIRTARDKLLLIQSYVPELAIGAIRAFNAAEQTLRLANQLAQGFNNFFGSSENSIQNNQQKFYQKIQNYWQTKTLFTIQTPWSIMDDMAIQSVRVSQDEESRFISDFELTFKKIRFSRTRFDSDNQKSGRLQTQASKKTNNGNIATSETPRSVGSFFT